MSSPHFTTLAYHFKTIVLFTRSDLKTVFFPVVLFAASVTQNPQAKCVFQAAAWVWLHLLQVNLSNQNKGADEDAIDKPWRPIPSGRISSLATARLRWLMLVVCLGVSYSLGIAYLSVALTFMSILYDHCRFDQHWLLKNVLNASAYFIFESAATLVVGQPSKPDHIATSALYMSCLIIVTTIQAQDFQDIEGDSLNGRRTIPIMWPRAARVYILLAIPIWSILVSVFWCVSLPASAALVILGTVIGFRYYRWRTSKEDSMSFKVYNIWLTIIHVIPWTYRSQVFSSLFLSAAAATLLPIILSYGLLSYSVKILAAYRGLSKRSRCA